MRKLLSDYKIGESGVIMSVKADPRIRRRLFDMGITPGAAVTLQKKAPFGDPIEVTLRGYELTLRLSEASNVETEVR